MADIFGKGGEPVPVSGVTFPPNHHEDKPWALYQATEDLPAQQSAKR